MSDSAAKERMQRYSDIIIEHSQFPHHHGSLEDPSHQGLGENPFCGDRLTLQLDVNEHGVIEKAAVKSVGCAISMASASLLATHLHGLTFSQAQELYEQVHRLVVEGLADGDLENREGELGELAALAFAGRYPSRVKCATLPWHVLKHILSGDDSVANTETVL